MSSMKNLVVMGGAMMAVRRLDQEDTETILLTRLFFALYILICCTVNLMLYLRVVDANDRTPLTVPPPPPSPFTPPKPPSEDEDENEDSSPAQQPDVITTVMAYDLGTLAASRKSWLMNAVILTLIHAKTGAINPLIMSSVMGLTKIVDEPLFKIHYGRAPAVGALKRPFEPEKNPLVSMMQGMMPPPPGSDGAAAGPPAGAADEGTVGVAGRTNGAAKNGADGLRRRTVASAVEVEELHDDGDDDEEDERPRPISADEDRPDDDDFADDKDAKKSK